MKAWKTTKGALEKDPQKFNSFAGFDVATMIDDAARNVALISNLAANEVLKEITGGKITAKTDSLVTLMQMLMVLEHCYTQSARMLRSFIVSSCTGKAILYGNQ